MEIAELARKAPLANSRELGTLRAKGCAGARRRPSAATEGDTIVAKARNRVLDYSVYLVVRWVVCAIQAVPTHWGYAFGQALAWLGYVLDRRHRRVALENLRLAFGNQYSEPQRHRMVREIYDHFARVLIEMVYLPRKLHKGNWKQHVHIDNAAEIVDAFLVDRPKLIVTGHFGNWEMANFLLAAIGLKSYAIARDLDNEYLHRFLMRFRQWSGQTILSKHGDFDRIEQVLSTNQVLLSVGDQSAGPKGYFVDFFGRPASTHKAMALLAIRHRALVFVGFAYRDKQTRRYVVGSAGTLDPRQYAEQPGGALAMTRDFTRILEAVIRRAPEQYLWLHNRWKHQPPPSKKTATLERAAA